MGHAWQPLAAASVAMIAGAETNAGVATGGRGTDAGPATHAIRISEIRVDQQGPDTDEYFELAGRPTASLAGIWFLAIGDGAADPGGVVEAAIDLTGLSLGENGRLVAHEASFGSAVLDGRVLTVDPAATRATIGTGDSINLENSDSVTYLLVRQFSGAVGADLDAGNDGTLDAAPWTELLDGVAFVRSGVPEPVYSDVRVGPVAVSATGGMPPHAWLGAEGWRTGEFASWASDSPGADTLPAPGAALTLVAAGLAVRQPRARSRRRTG